jgi:polyribonucleotide nucleotidyltransferase
MQSCVYARVPGKVDRNHPQPVKVTMAGNKDKVAHAKAIVTELMTYYRSSVTHPNAIHIEMNVPTALYNYIIGARGSEIKHIQGNFKVSVHIPNVDSVNRNVVIVGDAAGAQAAQKYIQKIMDQAVKDKEEVRCGWFLTCPFRQCPPVRLLTASVA